MVEMLERTAIAVQEESKQEQKQETMSRDELVAYVGDNQPLNLGLANQLASYGTETWREATGARYARYGMQRESGDLVSDIKQGLPLSPEAVVYLKELPNDQFREIIGARNAIERRPGPLQRLRPDTATVRLRAHTNLK